MKKYILIIAILISALSSSLVVSAQDWQPVGQTDERGEYANQMLFKLYRNFAKVPVVDIVVPTILEVDFKLNDAYENSFAVYDETAKKFIQSKLMYTESLRTPVVSSFDSITNYNLSSMFDDNLSTKEEFYLNNSDVGITKIKISFLKQIKSNELTLTLNKYISLPSSITIKTITNGKEVVVLNKYVPKSSRINFIETLAKDWIIEMNYSQPLDIMELDLNDLSNTTTKKSLRFLAQPKNSYTIYLNPENPVTEYFGESPNLSSPTGVKKVGFLSVQNNSVFVLADTDGDKIPDMQDNCVTTKNPNQEDIDGNGRGDVCDDFDYDSLANIIDNCPNTVNANQKDTDNDGIGDACDPDESRLTEKYPGVVWFGISFAAIVFLGLLFVAGNKIRKNNNEPNPPQTPEQPNNIN